MRHSSAAIGSFLHLGGEGKGEGLLEDEGLETLETVVAAAAAAASSASTL